MINRAIAYMVRNKYNVVNAKTFSVEELRPLVTKHFEL